MKANPSNKSLLRAISILDSFTRSGFELSGAEISRITGIHRASTHRILATLVDSGLVRRIDKINKYTIGLRLYKLGIMYLDSIDVFKIAKPVMETLNELTHEDVLMGMLEQGNIVLVMGKESKYHLRVGRRVGEFFPAYASAMGKVLLSEMTDTELDSLYPNKKLQPITRNTVSTKTELKLVLADVKRTGISYDREGARVGVEAVGAAIRDECGKAISALCIALPIIRSNKAKLMRLSKMVKMATDLISSGLGYQDASNTIYDINEIISWWDNQESLSPLWQDKDSPT